MAKKKVQATWDKMGIDYKRSMIDREDSRITIGRQCELLGISRSTCYYKKVRNPEKERFENKVKALISEIYLENPYYGKRRIRNELGKKNIFLSCKKVKSLMDELGIHALYPKPNLSKPKKENKKYPYLLRNVPITHANQVWSTDITYIKMERGFVYLAAVIDWYSRYVLSWRISTTLESGFCCDALREALVKYGKPEIFNTDQGAQFTDSDFTGILKDAKIQISMDGKGRALDNIYCERLWRTVKYEEIFLKSYESVPHLRSELGKYFRFYDYKRDHSAHGYRTPWEVYSENSEFGKTGETA